VLAVLAVVVGGAQPDTMRGNDDLNVLSEKNSWYDGSFGLGLTKNSSNELVGYSAKLKNAYDAESVPMPCTAAMATHGQKFCLYTPSTLAKVKSNRNSGDSPQCSGTSVPEQNWLVSLEAMVSEPSCTPVSKLTAACAYTYSPLTNALMYCH